MNDILKLLNQSHRHAAVDVFSFIFKGKIKLIHFLFWQSFNYWTVKTYAWRTEKYKYWL